MDNVMVNIREYEPSDKVAWLRCRVLAYLDTSYHDDVRTTKPMYENPSIELVATEGEYIAGFLDIECEASPGDICSNRPGLGAMIWDVAVHPDWRRRGIAAQLLEKAVARLQGQEIVRLEAWTRDDEAANAWYIAQGFEKMDSYLHVYVGRGEEAIVSTIPGLMPICSFAQYTGEDTGAIRDRFSRVHECSLFELRLRNSV